MNVDTAARTSRCAGQGESCDLIAPSVFAGGFGGGVVTNVAVEVNTFFGQFGSCKKDANDNAWHCEADWKCWCDHDYGGNNDNSNPCAQGGVRTRAAPTIL